MNNAVDIKWNKDIPYYELPLTINSNLSNDTLEWVNNHYNFLIHNLPVFNIFYVTNNSIEYKSYTTKTEEFYNLKEGLDTIINKFNIVKDKKMCLIIELKKKSNYYRIRYEYIDMKNIYLKCDKQIKAFIRKQKIELLLTNNDKKTFKQFVNSINNTNILTEEISSLHI